MEQTISRSEKISILMALIQEDRVELRQIKNIIFNYTYVAIASIVTITAFFILNKQSVEVSFRQFSFIIAGIFLIYITAFSYLKYILTESRKCLEARETFLEDINKLNTGKFKPLVDISKVDGVKITDNYLYTLVFFVFFTLLVCMAVFSSVIG